jgi:hypothetical protein
MNLPRSSLASITLLLLGLFLSTEAIAQQSQDSSAIVWWVVGTGGTLAASNADGDTLSATLGQTAADSATVDDSTYGKIGYGIPRAALTAHLGFWLPRRNGLDESQPAVAGTHNTLGLASNPNPFSDKTTISYQLPADGESRLEIFDARGNRVRLLVDEAQSAGTHRVIWGGENDAGGVLPAGAYFYRVELISGADNSRQSASGMIYRIK